MREQEPIVSIASSQRSWAAELLRFLSDHGGARLAGTVLTAEDALDQDYEVLVIDDIASYLSPRVIERIHRMQRRVLGVYDGDLGEAARTRVFEMGADAAIESEASSDEFLEVIASLCEPHTIATPPRPENPSVEAPKRITAVAGGDLALDVVLSLGAGLTARGQSTLIIDADTVSPALAQRLSLPLVPNVLTALDALIQLRGRPGDSLVAGPEGTVLLTGLPRPSEWGTVRATDVVDLCDQLAPMHGAVLVKVSHHIEDLSQLGGKHGRFEVSRALLRMSADVAYVADPTPVGLSRTLAWIAAVRRLTDARIHVLFGDAPSSLFQRGELTEELTRSFMPASITWLPDDARRVRSAWNGAPVPRGPFQKALDGLAATMLSVSQAGVA